MKSGLHRGQDLMYQWIPKQVRKDIGGNGLRIGVCNDSGRQPHPRPLSLARRGGDGEWYSGGVTP